MNFVLLQLSSAFNQSSQILKAKVQALGFTRLSDVFTQSSVGQNIMFVFSS